MNTHFVQYGIKSLKNLIHVFLFFFSAATTTFKGRLTARIEKEAVRRNGSMKLKFDIRCQNNSYFCF